LPSARFPGILDDQTTDRSGAAPVPDQDAGRADPPRPEPYRSNWGPSDGPILGNDCPVGLVEHRRGPAQTFRLVTDKTELPGRWLCVGRRFARLGEAAEEL
jgi:hypothetical protein